MSDDLIAKAGIDTTDFKTGVSQLTASIKAIEAGFRASAAVMDDWSGTSTGLRERVSSLSQILDTQKSKLQILREEFDKVVSSQGADSKAAQSLASQMFSVERQITNTQSSLSQYSDRLRTVETEERESSSSLAKLKSAFSSLGEQSEKTSLGIGEGLKNLKSAIMGFAAGAISSFSLKEVIDAADEEEKSIAQLDAVLKSTNDASGMTAESAEELAKSLSGVTTFSKDAVLSSENMLLTFTNIGKNVFPQATQTVLDMSQALGQDTKSSAIQLGKALNDPIKGITALQRVGVSFTEAQKKQIKAMVDAGNTAGAQKLILEELNREFGNSAKAAGSTLSGQLQIAKNSFKEMGAEIGVALMPTIKEILPMFLDGLKNLAEMITSHKTEIQDAVIKVATVVKDIFSFISQHGEGVKVAIIGIASAFAAFKTIGTVMTVFNTATKGIQDLQGAAKGAKIFENLFAMPPQVALIIGIIAAVAALAYLIIKNWGPISNFFKNLWSDVTNWTTNAWNNIKNFFSGLFSWIGNFFKQWGPLILTFITPFIGLPLLIIQHWSQIKEGLASIWNGLKSAMSSAWNEIKNIFTTVVNGIATFVNDKFSWLINGAKTIFDGFKTYLGGVWNLIKSIILGPVLLIIDLVTGNFSKLRSDAIGIFNSLKDAFGQIWEGIKTIFTGAINIIVGFFKLEWEGLVIIGTTIWNGFKSFMGSLWDGIKNTAVSAWNALKSAVVSLINGIVQGAVNTWDGLINFFRNLPGTMYSLGVNMFSNMKSGISNILGTIGSVIANGFNNSISLITSLPSKALQWGKDFIQGLINGIKSMINGVANAVTGVADKIRSILHFSVPDEGPLTNYESWMPDFMGGLAKGITNNTGKLKEAALNAASVLSNGLKVNANIGTQTLGASDGAYGGTTTNNSSSNIYITINAPGADVSKQQDMAALTKTLCNQLALETAKRK